MTMIQIKYSKLLFTWFSIRGSELIGEDLDADPVDAHSEDVIGNRRIPRLDWPQRLA